MKRALSTAFKLSAASLVIATAFSASAIIKGRMADLRIGKASVYIYDSRNQASCTGVVVHPRLILTAGHCLVKTTPGALSFSNASSPGEATSSLPIQSLHVSEGYKGATHGMQSVEQSMGDLGLILMKEPILKKLKLTEADLPPVATKMSEIGSNLRIVGYGYFSRDGKLEDAARRELMVQIESSEGNLRLGSLEDKKSACFGDSGSGVMADDGAKARLLGVVCSIKPGGKLAEEFKAKTAKEQAENEVKRQKIIARNLKKGITTEVPVIPVKLPDSLMSRVCGDKDTVTQAVLVSRHLCWIQKTTSISLAPGLNCSAQE